MSSLKDKPLFDERIKLKNVLALNEKIQAIRCYEANPVYKKVGRIFNCSPDQIKRIVHHKERYLAEWENRTRKSVAPTPLELKTVSISILGKAVHEWIRRIMYYTDFFLNDTLIKTMAMEFAKVLNIQKFTPTKEWISQFRATYKLPDANTKTMNIGYQESLSVQILDILRYVRSTCVEVDEAKPSPNIYVPEVKSETVTVVKMESDDQDDMISDIVKTEVEVCEPSSSSRVRSLVDDQVRSPEKNVQGQVPMEEDSAMKNFDFEIKTEVPEPETLMNPTFEEETKSEPVEEPEPESLIEPLYQSEAEPNPDLDNVVVNTHQGAVNCVKLLEDFALLKENFRLIGLIERLEEALNEKPRGRS